jgi:hypothetical protein
MTIGALLEEDRRNVSCECDLLHRRFRVFGPARPQREQRCRSANNCDNNDETYFFHFFINHFLLKIRPAQRSARKRAVDPAQPPAKARGAAQC